MKKLVLAAFIFASTISSNVLADIKMGVILGFTGPIESLTPAMAASAELAFKEASDSGSLLGGQKISVERADSTCVDSAAATAAAEGLVSDHRYAQALVSHRVSTGYGPHRIMMELKDKGVAPEIIDQTLLSAEVDWDELLRAQHNTLLSASSH